MLETRQLSCERGGRVLFNGLSFSVGAGEILRVAGNNGSGKTTLLRILCGLYQDFDGEIDWDLDDHPLYVGHRPGVKDLLTARENLAWLARLYMAEVAMTGLGEALARVGLAGYEDVACGAMSEGQRKRVNLARLYLLKSPAWILDEPFSSIDAGGVSDLESAMAEHVASGGLILLTSHQRLELPVTTIDLGVS